MGGIVVGMDGSKGSAQALRWALEEARLRGTEVRACFVVDRIYTEPEWASLIIPSADELLREGKRLLANAVTKVEGGEDVRQEVLIGEGHGPAKALLDAASDADMLVVGSRGRGGFQGLLLGSVSQQVLHHAKCPVVVVPPS